MATTHATQDRSYARSADEVLQDLEVSLDGLHREEVIARQLMSNVATVLVIAPVAVAVAAALDVSILPFMMALTVSGAAAFLTPVSTPVNLMVMQPGGYRFGDYWRTGLPLTLLYVAAAVLYVPLVWPF